MFQWLVAEVVNVLGIVWVAADGRLPEPVSSDSALATGDPHPLARLGGRNGADEADFDGLAAVRAILVNLRQRQDARHVLGRHYPSVEVESPPPRRPPHRPAQRVNLPCQQIRPPLQRVESSKMTEPPIGVPPDAGYAGWPGSYGPNPARCSRRYSM